MLAIGASRRVTATSSISKSFLVDVLVGMGATVSIPPFSDLARETGEAEPFGAADRPDVHGHFEWRETVIGRDGTLIRNEPWTATVTFVVTPPSTAEQVMLNPDGIFVTAYSWEARL